MVISGRCAGSGDCLGKRPHRNAGRDCEAEDVLMSISINNDEV